MGWRGSRSTGGGSETRFIPSSLKELAVPVVQGAKSGKKEETVQSKMKKGRYKQVSTLGKEGLPLL